MPILHQSPSISGIPEAAIWKYLRKHLNFYRIHIIFLSVQTSCPFMHGWSTHTAPRSTITPLIFSGIFYASNGEFHISYIDALFNCVSAMMVCGLATVDLSSLTGWQQGILFIQMCLGSPVCIFRSLTSGSNFLFVYLGFGFMGHGVHSEVGRGFTR